MQNLLNFFLTALRYSRAMAYVEAASAADAWTPADARTLQGFMNTPVGVKLSQRLSNYAIRSATSAVRQSDSNGWHTGRAAGVFDGITALQTHLPQQREQADGAESNMTAFEQKYAA